MPFEYRVLSHKFLSKALLKNDQERNDNLKLFFSSAKRQECGDEAEDRHFETRSANRRFEHCRVQDQSSRQFVRQRKTRTCQKHFGPRLIEEGCSKPKTFGDYVTPVLPSKVRKVEKKSPVKLFTAVPPPRVRNIGSKSSGKVMFDVAIQAGLNDITAIALLQLELKATQEKVRELQAQLDRCYCQK